MLTSRSVLNAGVQQVLRLSTPMCYVPFTTSRVKLAASQNGSPVTPIDIPQLAKMAQIKVTKQEVSRHSMQSAVCSLPDEVPCCCCSNSNSKPCHAARVTDYDYLNSGSVAGS